MADIIKMTKKNVTVNVNGITFKLENENVNSQINYLEKVVPEHKNTFSFAQFFEPIPTVNLF